MRTFEELLSEIELLVLPSASEDTRISHAQLVYGGEQVVALDLLLHSAARTSTPIAPDIVAEISAALSDLPEYYKQDVEEMREQLALIAGAA